MSNIEEFVTNNSNCGDGSGYGGCDSGLSDGYGNGYSYGDGSGSGDGSGNGDGRGDGNGCGNDCGNGNCCDNRDIKSFNGKTVYYIDYLATIITKVKRNVAKGFILNIDFTTTPCYIVKHDNSFAHGKTIAEAREALRNKLFKDMDDDERINAFLNRFNLTDKHPAKDFFDWHNLLTGSCKQGRKIFVKNHEIELEKDKFTVAEFCEICKNDYGGDIIKEIIKRIS